MTHICIIGAGPRGLSVLERLHASAAGQSREITVHVVDPNLHNGSAVWRTDQSRELLMNTVAAQITMFADETVSCAGPIVPGPSLHEWARFVEHLGPEDRLPDWARAECRELGPDSYPTRALYGHYLRWVLRHLLRTTPDNLTIALHANTATSLVDADDGSQVVELDDGTVLDGLDSVVLTQGHVPSMLSEAETALAEYAARHHLAYVPPGNPAGVDLSFLKPGQEVALRGMGLNFFDYMALLTTGRGGRFSRGDTGSLTYHPSGAEPVLIAGSRRGVPYTARGENQKGAFGRHEPLFLTPWVIRTLRRRAERGRPADFRTEVWPLIDREVRSVYYTALVTERSCVCEAEVFSRRYRAVCEEEFAATPVGEPFDQPRSEAESVLLDRFGIAEADRWDWNAIAKPYGDREFADADDYRKWLTGYLREDIREALRGNVRSPLKSALDAMRDLRNEIRLVVDHGGLSGDSYRDDLQRWYTPFNAFVSIGPPVSRIEEMTALIEAGVLRVVGPGMVVEPAEDDSEFLVSSTKVPGPPVRVTALIEARLPEPDIRTTTDPLLGGLLARGECVLHQIPIAGGGHYETGGLAVSPRPYNVLGKGRVPHPRRFAYGVPTETVHWVTAAGIRPGVNSVILADADAVAQATLAISVPRTELIAGF
ncbi:FAD/NAD(P)-binding protein [Actinokineospora auranticolor]|uniref:FAD-NAD(P)-binding protein n=1 Tax=Actinokineospora auranticolor TaxID=155976 RepID=A0A2S6GKJ3_9PSEU|nr:FAD/NAD(P)-binding protein [Actinokineospora auranticolor]PPK65671.1 FAD-NAD(P)-binding protein [Actinokineospora auranticolor]